MRDNRQCKGISWQGHKAFHSKENATARRILRRFVPDCVPHETSKDPSHCLRPSNPILADSIETSSFYFPKTPERHAAVCWSHSWCIDCSNCFFMEREWRWFSYYIIVCSHHGWRCCFIRSAAAAPPSSSKQQAPIHEPAYTMRGLEILFTKLPFGIFVIWS